MNTKVRVEQRRATDVSIEYRSTKTVLTADLTFAPIAARPPFDKYPLNARSPPQVQHFRLADERQDAVKEPTFDSVRNDRAEFVEAAPLHKGTQSRVEALR